MAVYTASLTAENTFAKLCTVNKKRDFIFWFATILYWGTFGGGTITFYLSPDQGTTKIPLQDLTGQSQTATAQGNFSTSLGGGSTNTNSLELWVGVGAATNPSINLMVQDNNA